MHNEFTAIIEQDGDWYIAYCPEIPGANGQGRTIEECRRNLAEAIALILEDRREEGTIVMTHDLLSKMRDLKPQINKRFKAQEDSTFRLNRSRGTNRRQ